ncbi:MAG: putative glycoside hydrolase [Oscillospiraceae bacterium]
MDRHTKIKRHKHIYHKSIFRITPLSAIILVVSGLLLFGLGWVLYEPVYSIITGDFKTSQTEKLQPEPPAVIPTPQTSTPDVKPPSDTAKPNSVPNTSNSVIKAAYLPFEIVADKAQFSEALDTLKTKGFTDVMIDLKNPYGNVLYSSQSTAATTLGTITTNPFNASDAVKLIKQKGLQPIARIYAFKDALAANKNLSMAISYNGTKWLWLDNSIENGGKPWLNPYSLDAQKYISELTNEAADLGFTRIILDSVQFPQGVGLELADYGENSSAKTKSAVLSDFVKELKSSAQQKGSQLYIFADSTAATDNNTAYFGGDTWAVCGTSPVISITGDAEAVKMLTDSINAKLNDTSNVVAMLELGAESQIDALKAAGIENYIIYNNAGKY